jgi:putative spermidine/putrescine transport system ATP-binding protein
VQLREEIRRIQTRLGITTLYVTHDQEEALSVSDRVAVLSQGQIEQVGTPAEIYGDPRTAFVAQFVGTMNRITGTIPPGGKGLVECNGTLLRAASARAWSGGAHVLLLIRPESIELDRLADDTAAPEGDLDGRVRAHTFMGPVTRLTVASAIGEIMVDVGSARALSLGEGTRVGLTWDPVVPRLIDLAEAGGTPARAAPALAAELSFGELQGVESPVQQ